MRLPLEGHLLNLSTLSSPSQRDAKLAEDLQQQMAPLKFGGRIDPVRIHSGGLFLAVSFFCSARAPSLLL
jgi:hypothetical protein